MRLTGSLCSGSRMNVTASPAFTVLPYQNIHTVFERLVTMKDYLFPVIPYLLLGAGFGFLYTRAAPRYVLRSVPLASLPGAHDVCKYLRSQPDLLKQDSAFENYTLAVCANFFYESTASLRDRVKDGGALSSDYRGFMLLTVGLCGLITRKLLFAVPFLVGFFAWVYFSRRRTASADYVEDFCFDRTEFYQYDDVGKQLDYACSRNCNILNARSQALLKQITESVPYRSAFWFVAGLFLSYHRLLKWLAE